MSLPPKLTFRGITRAVLERLWKKAQQNGFAVVRPSREAVKGGIKIHWNYDPERGLLELECVRTPFWFDVACVQNRLRGEIESTLEPGRAA